MGFVEATKTCLRKYVVFSGRASRSEFWWFILATVLVAIVAIIIDASMFGFSESSGPFELVTNLLLALPTLSATVRRFHDTGRSGYYVLALCTAVACGLISFALFEHDYPDTTLFVGGFFLLITVVLSIWWQTRPSEPGSNVYGPNPHEVSQ